MLVEAAFLLPFLFALVFGIIDFGFTFNDWISVRQGGRDGLRQVIVNTKPVPAGGGSWTCPNPSGLTGDAYNIACFTKARVGLDQNKTAVSVFFTDGTFTAGQPVKICVQYQTSSLTGAYSTILNTKVLDTEVESLIEQNSTTFIHPFAEASFNDTKPGGGHTAVTWAAACSQL